MTRDYELKRRAEQMADTRRRITEAAIDLHSAVGPVRTTVSAISERAGVQRQTFYRHFPDDKSLLLACSGLYMERHPLPDPDAWPEIADPSERLRHGLDELYRYFAAHEDLLANLRRDLEVDEVTREVTADIYPPAMAKLHAALSEGLKGDQLAPALDLAIDFNTWQLLVGHSGLSHEQAVDFAVRLVTCAAET